MASVDVPTKPGFWGWLNKRMPVEQFLREQLLEYYAPKNFNIWYFFGSLAMLVLVMQLFTGIFLTMFYKVGDTTAFDSVEYIMREVDYGWLIRYLHSTGASAFFLVVYLHMYRALMYGSYKAPRELLWLFGMFIYLALMAEGFMGYVLPWGNMSYWAAQVIINLFGTIPVFGPGLVEWIRGDYGIADATIDRFFALHVVRFRSSCCCWWRCTSWRCARLARTTLTASRSRSGAAPTASRWTAFRSTRITPSRMCSAWACS